MFKFFVTIAAVTGCHFRGELKNDDNVDLLDYYREKCGVSDKLTMETRNGNRGLFAKETLERGEELLNAGDQCRICGDDILRRFPVLGYQVPYVQLLLSQFRVDKEYGLDNSEYLMIILYLLMDRESPYVRALPRDIELLPQFWPIKGFRSDFPESPWREAQFDLEMRSFQQALLLSWPFKLNIDREMIQWAQTVRTSRTVAIKTQDPNDGTRGDIACLIPVFDMFNHHVRFNLQYRTGVEAPPGSTLIMTTNSEVQKGDEIFTTYGRLTNWSLLKRYGFALEAFHLEPEKYKITFDLNFMTKACCQLHPEKENLCRDFIQTTLYPVMEELNFKGRFRLKYGEFPEEIRTFHDQYKIIFKCNMEKLIQTALEILLVEETFSVEGVPPSQLKFVDLVLQG